MVNACGRETITDDGTAPLRPKSKMLGSVEFVNDSLLRDDSDRRCGRDEKGRKGERGEGERAELEKYGQRRRPMDGMRRKRENARGDFRSHLTKRRGCDFLMSGLNLVLVLPKTCFRHVTVPILIYFGIRVTIC